MIQEVRYNGFTASPSDYECSDGDLADVLNMIPEDGSLKAATQPKAVLGYLEYNILIEHSTSEYTHYIATNDSGALYWLSPIGEQTATLIHNFGSASISQVTSVGNTLVILTSQGVYYALWDKTSSTYRYLGARFPECPISFGLVGESRYYSKLTYENGKDANGKFEITHAEEISNGYAVFSDENKRAITGQALAKVNRFVEEISVGENRFIYPFFVRYGYRLYDDSLAHISAPVLMLPCTYTNPYVLCSFGTSETQADIFAISAKLDYKALISDNEASEIAKWKDLIKSVDVFISAPIYTYDQSGECESYNGGRIGTFVGKFIPTVNPTVSRGEDDNYKISAHYQSWNIEQLYGYENGFVGFTDWKLKLPEFSATELDRKVQECSTFFLLSSIKVEDLVRDKRVAVPIEEGILGSLVNREVMTDDYQSHDKLFAKRSFSYNNRINLSGVRRKLFQGFDLASMVAYVDGHYTLSIGTTHALDFTSNHIESVLYSTFTKIDSDEGMVYVKQSSNTPLSASLEDFYFLYYPNTSATEMYLVSEDDDTQSDGKVAMQAHTFLNGSSAFRGLRGYTFLSGVQESPEDQSNIAYESNLNKIYTSEVNNPFYFPLLGINTIGGGEVLGVSTAAKALSQGQFGQFPLYAFCTDGVWALEVTATGSYSARQPITRDVCINPESITQIDSAVLFATDRGIMLLSGSETTCITDILDSDVAVSLLDFPYGIELSALTFGTEVESPFRKVTFKEFLLGCGILYDYTHQRIIVFNSAHEYAYVYSIESKMWGMIVCDIDHAVPSYPRALAMSHKGSPYGTLWDYSQEGANEKSVFITRPLKLGSPDVLKTVTTVIQRGYFKKGHVKSALYGSRDLENWAFVASSTDHYLRGFRGTPYKYYRIAVLADLEPQESLFGCTVQFEPKKMNQPR